VMAQLDTSLDTIGHILDVLRKGVWTPSRYHSDLAPWDYPDKEAYEAKLKEWKREKMVRFMTFWGSPTWGVREELTFIKGKNIALTGNIFEWEWWQKVELDEGGYPVNLENIDKFYDPTNHIGSIMWLGKIKKAASDLILR
jgi:hypothetical protein